MGSNTRLNNGLDPDSLRYVQSSRAWYGYVLRYQVALRSRAEKEGEAEGRGVARGWQAGRTFRVIALGPGVCYLLLCRGAWFGPGLLDGGKIAGFCS